MRNLTPQLSTVIETFITYFHRVLSCFCLAYYCVCICVAENCGPYGHIVESRRNTAEKCYLMQPTPFAYKTNDKAVLRVQPAVFMCSTARTQTSGVNSGCT
jgi:hypothetical protein